MYKKPLTAVVLPLSNYVKHVLTTPIILHDAQTCPWIVDSFGWCCCGSAEREESWRPSGFDILSVVKDSLAELLPFPWMAFASDTAAAFAQTGHFKENTQEASFGQCLVFSGELFHA